jgi:hypothetical protein
LPCGLFRTFTVHYIRNIFYFQTLATASKAGDAAEVANLLSQEGIKVDYKQIGEDASPLGHPARNGHYETAKLLLEAGANVLAGRRRLLYHASPHRAVTRSRRHRAASSGTVCRGQR